MTTGACVRSIVVIVAMLMPSTFVRLRAQGATSPALHAAQTMFYNGRYAEAAAATADLCKATVEALPACELRSAAIHFQIRRAIGDAPDKGKAFTQCAECSAWFTTFVAQIRQGQAVTRAHLKTNPGDDETLFFLGKIDLNYVWLQLGTLGRKTGLEEYREARRSLDAVLKRNPGHVRAKVARSWIDYIVDTKMPFGTKWILGGGNKKKGLQAAREAADAEADLFTRAEAVFALWELQVREKNITGAVATARRLAIDFPDNPEVRKFLEVHGGSGT
jgi:hypothetical protein